jgi:hypothetical protein
MDDKDWDYLSLSKRFESFAERATDPKLAAAYRSLAEHYRVLERWRQKTAERYEQTPPRPSTASSSEPSQPADSVGAHPPQRGKPT